MTRDWRPDDPWAPGNPENRVRTRALQAQLRERLLAWDPIGVAAGPGFVHEYDWLISPLMHQLHEGRSERQISQWLLQELRTHVDLPGDSKRERRLADELVAWWAQATSP